MDTRDILNIFLILGIATISVCFILITIFVIQALKAVQDLADHIKDTTANLKQGFNLKALAAVPPILVSIIGRIIKRGR